MLPFRRTGKRKLPKVSSKCFIRVVE
jgi:hypothetical protein